MRIFPTAVLLIFLATPPVAFAIVAGEPDASDRLLPRHKALAAMGAFRHAFAARGKKGEDKLHAQHEALVEFAKATHPLVADRLLKIASGTNNEELRTGALAAIASMKKMPAYAGERLSEGLRKRGIKSDPTSVAVVIQAFVDLPYVPASSVWKGLFKHKDLSVQQAAIKAIGSLGDDRMLSALISMLAEIDLAQKGNRTGTGFAGGGGAATAGRRAAGRTRLRPDVVEAIKKLTGQEFERAADARAWLEANPEKMHKVAVKLSDLLSKQERLLKQSIAWAKDKR